MYGAILGDIIGSPYEFDQNNIKTTEFELFSERSEFTDDSIMTLAVAEALMDCGIDAGEETMKKALVDSMKKYGGRYPFAGYGADFSMWIAQEDPKPYNSCSNGSAMRVSAVPWLCQEDMAKMFRIAALTASVSHDHPEGIKGAQAVAAVIFMAIHGASKQAIRDTVSKVFSYDLLRTCDEIRPGYHYADSCQQTVPEAICAFLEGDSFEEVIRLAVSLGGDSDTLTCMAGSMAEAFTEFRRISGERPGTGFRMTCGGCLTGSAFRSKMTGRRAKRTRLKWRSGRTRLCRADLQGRQREAVPAGRRADLPEDRFRAGSPERIQGGPPCRGSSEAKRSRRGWRNSERTAREKC